ncbi:MULTISPECIES: polysaccharide biosynthesis protein [unclassified Sulfitobacter]|uniref:polysaccharide biosynthesis protein n=3 Tax=Sulfitobacter TaxID=60136 RepID=UPI0007C3F7B1|nr:MULTISPECIES: nucleoside-diphosphate sugar epimerase/dehydratase [unclassified Sulfitobacter]KZY04613.1 NADH-dependent dehydratase [Sulfitobacter sp. HI0023]KZY25870.1 NADH-dependent dehydratase [Sulfitobacter sp. HI0040]
MKPTDIHDLSRAKKRAIFLAVDTLLVPLSLYCAFALRYGSATPWIPVADSWVLFPVLTLWGAGIIWALRLHRIKLNAFDTHSMSNIGLAALLLAVSAILLSYMMDLFAPRSVPLLSGLFFYIFAISARLGGLALLRNLAERGGDRKPVAIYGAGAAGIQLAAALRQASEARPVFFIDDNPNLHGLMVAGLPVHGPDKLAKLIDARGIQQILLAVPSMPVERRHELISKLKVYDVEVQVLPSYIEMMSGKGLVQSLRTVAPDQLLGRDKVALDTPEIAKTYAGRVVMVTGAGGAIGSELCRQLLNCNPARIILFEQGEFQLYSIDQELQAEAKSMGIPIHAKLGSITNKERVAGVIAEEEVDIILHAAAYIHLPLVQDNEVEVARNNVIGTQVVAEAAAEAKLERFILVSTDKAVRPTNILGATKRMAELVVQDTQTRNRTTKFAMVRFGNVLGSSGSVLPLFQRQIARGGPVTVTHKDLTRFFMTIPEAARLVLLAGAYATGGDVFVLHMGEPQKIIDIAHRMITLSGLKVKDPVTGEGDIEVKVTGLRPGEKLYEELLIDDDSLLPTPHAKILRAQEGMLSQIEVASMLRELQNAITDADTARLRRLIATRVEGYHVQGVTAG